jgi:leucyl/phenylalanyl-tRNA--protein transferase
MTTITPRILLEAYRAGIFPMAESAEDNALYWVEPEERGYFPLADLHVSQSLRKLVRQRHFDIRVDTDFAAVIAGCAEQRPERRSTWINGRIRRLYGQLHDMGACHSVEAWHEGTLAGGLYGVKIGAAFFGESMFTRVSGASKVALVHLVARLNFGGFKMLDAQFMNAHIATLGARPMKKAEFMTLLPAAVKARGDFFAFKGDDDPAAVLQWALPGK